MNSGDHVACYCINLHVACAHVLIYIQLHLRIASLC